jgi:hypothetical protein
MELIWLAIEALGVLLDILNLLFVFADIVSWIKGKENRIERKRSKQNGMQPPKRDRWNRAFILFLIGVLLFTGLIVVRTLQKQTT